MGMQTGNERDVLVLAKTIAANEFPVERYLRNSKAAVIYEGTSQLHTLIQADYALGYREDRPLRCEPLPAEGFELLPAPVAAQAGRA